MLTEERRIYYTRSVEIYEEFLTREHKPEFYTKVINFPAGYKRTNVEHIQCLIRDAKEELKV